MRIRWCHLSTIPGTTPHCLVSTGGDVNFLGTVPPDPPSLDSMPLAHCYQHTVHALGMGIVENSTVWFGSRFCFYGFLNGLLMTFLGYETTQWNAWLNLPELESSWKFLYTSSLGTFSTLRRLLSIVKVGRVPDLRDFEKPVWLSRLADIVRPARR